MSMAYIIGLTGGIASGKSTISKYIEKKGIPIIDADLIAREVVELGTTGLEKIVSAFGRQYLHSDGTLNRKKLGKLIFSDEVARERLAEVLDQEILNKILEKTEELKKRGHSLIIWDIALLFEKQYQQYVDEVLLVRVDSEVQLQRLMVRDKISKEDALKKVNSQFSLEEKEKRTNHMIDNSMSIESTYQQVDQWLEKLDERMWTNGKKDYLNR